MDELWVWTIYGMTEVHGQKHDALPLRLPQMPHALAWVRCTKLLSVPTCMGKLSYVFQYDR
jgi:hypothetical protein